MSAPGAPVGSAEAALRAGIATLASAGIDGAANDARRLLAHALGTAPDRLTLHLPAPLPPAARDAFAAALGARAGGRPVARILGYRDFWGRRFEVTDDTLDPRPETETLVALALDRPWSRLADLGTGTGILAVTLLAERTGAGATATDISAPALAVAARNAALHGVDERLHCVRSDWWDGVAGRFDLVVSNPPYIAAHEMPDLAPEVRGHDPAIALCPGVDGLAAYRAILAGARGHLSPGGMLMVEIGWRQGAAVEALFARAGLEDVRLHADLDGRNRAVTGSAP